MVDNVSLQAVKIPFTHDWLYRVFVDGEKFDQFSTSQKLIASEMLDVESYYKEALDAYLPARLAEGCGSDSGG